MEKHIKLVIATVSVLTAIMCIIFVSRNYLENSSVISINTMSSNVVYLEEEGLNQSEAMILNRLYDGLVKVGYQQELEVHNPFYTNLKNYFSYPEIDLSEANASIIKDQIDNLNDIILLENEWDFQKMSSVGRERAITVATNLYETCGLKLNISEDGVIGYLLETTDYGLDQTGTSMLGSGFNVNLFIGVIALLFVMLVLCIVLARKKNIYIKQDTKEINEKHVFEYSKV